MKSYYCKRLYEEVNFDAENIYVCCGMSLGPSFSVPNPQKEKLSSFIRKLIDWKTNCSKEAYLGNVAEQCKNCIELQEREISKWEYYKTKFSPKSVVRKKFPVKNIIVKSYRQCELSCIYCLERRYTKGHKTFEVCKSEFYDFLPLFKAFINEGVLDKKLLSIEFQGGSITVWDEFLPALKEAKDFNVNHLMYHTNAITFVPEVVESPMIDSSMSIAIDCGSKETYKKIKGGDYFDNVISNIIKYADAGISCSVKYIIVSRVNDNLEEIKKFLDTIVYIRNSISNPDKISVMMEIDFRDSLTVKNYSIPDSYLELFKYAIDFCKERNISLGYQCFIRDCLNRQLSNAK